MGYSFESMARIVFIANFASTLFMVGLIWLIQIVHYPMFARVGTDQFPEYERIHSQSITWIVAPVMLVELATATLLAFGAAPASSPQWHWWVGLAAVIAIWLSTWFLQIPCHTLLSAKFDEAVHSRLVNTNWIRTVLWTFRGALLCVALRAQLT